MGPDIAIEEVVETLSLQDLDALRRVLDAMPHPIFIKDDQLRFVVLNQCMCEFMGHPFESLIGQTDHAFVPKEHADVFQRIDRLVLETGEVNENEELIPGSTWRDQDDRHAQEAGMPGQRRPPGRRHHHRYQRTEAARGILAAAVRQQSAADVGIRHRRPCGSWPSTRPRSSTMAIRANSSWR